MCKLLRTNDTKYFTYYMSFELYTQQQEREWYKLHTTNQRPAITYAFACICKLTSHQIFGYNEKLRNYSQIVIVQ